jgi:hypothetical protein
MVLVCAAADESFVLYLLYIMPMRALLVNLLAVGLLFDSIDADEGFCDLDLVIYFLG